MLKKLFCLALLCFLVFSVNAAYAKQQGAMSADDFRTQLNQIYLNMVKANQDYVKAETAARKATCDKLAALGTSEKDKEMRKQVIDDARKNRLDLRKQWMDAKADLVKQELALRSQSAKMYEESKAAMLKSGRAGQSHIQVVNPED